MDIVYAALFGIIQGLTEFLPVSSSGHLVLLHDLFNFELKSSLGFDVFLHVGTLVALFGFFYKDIGKIIKGFFQSFKKWDLKNNSNQKIAWFIILGTIPAALAGFFLDSIIENYFRETWLVALMLLIVGALFFLVEKVAKRTKEMKEMKWYDSLLVGIAQAIALIPGVSRSGITIITGMTMKLKRHEAARFAFLLSIPIILGAGIKKVIDLSIEGFVSSELLLYIVGFVFSAVVGYFCVKYFIRYLNKYSLRPFGWYRIVIAIIIFLFLI